MSYPRFVYCTRYKAASMWIGTIVESVCSIMGLRYEYLFNWDKKGIDLRSYCANEKLEFVALASPSIDDAVVTLSPEKGFHVYRDPRDMIVSAYYSFRNSHAVKKGSSLEALQQKLQEIPMEEGLFECMAFHAGQLDHLNAWDYTQENILNLQMEAVSANPYMGFLRIFRFIDLVDEADCTELQHIPKMVQAVINKMHRRSMAPMSLKMDVIPAERLLGVVHRNRYEKRSGRKKGEEDVASHYRKGKAGDWTTHFTPEHVQYFKDRFPGLVEKLGYEDSSGWTLPNT